MIRLSQKCRPAEVNLWQRNSEDSNVQISDTTAFGTAWIAWWVDCQPAARSPGSEWPLPQVEIQRPDWGKMLYGGKNGIFLFVIAMSWWANSLDPANPPPNFFHAFADLKWTLEQLNQSAASTPTPPSPPRSTLGKRNIRLSERAAEAPALVRKMFTR